MGAKLGSTVQRSETSWDANGEPVYHVVYLTENSASPAGFVIVSGDDEAEPIVAFCSGNQFDPSPKNPLGALVSKDLPKRIAHARQPKSGVLKFSTATTEAKRKWDALLQPSGISGLSMSEAPVAVPITDVRVEPLILSTWDQSNVAGSPCYNYYTPNNYLAGCVATAMAQVMRYHGHPTTSVGTESFTVWVDDNEQEKRLRGGNGTGGPYNWAEMVLEPSTTSMTLVQRQAIGALLYDAGVSVHMEYSANWSAAYVASYTADALVQTFKYSNAITAHNNQFTNIGDTLIKMVNPNLDAGYPVLFAISGDDAGGHAIVCDGYGYNAKTLYHHLNMGWSGFYDTWYALPTIDPAGYEWDTINTCVYNIFPSGAGEIISGRVTDSWDSPIVGATVTAEIPSGHTYTATTGPNGIYAFAKMPSSTSYTLTTTMDGYVFSSRTIAATQSIDHSVTTGNVWGVDFAASEDGKTSNDNFADAWVETAESWVSVTNNSKMTKELRETKGLIGNLGSHSGWWIWTAPASWPSLQPVKISTEGSSFDTLLECYTGNALFDLAIVKYNDDEKYPGITTSAISFNAVPGRTYRLAVDGKDGATGSIRLTLSGPVTISASALPSTGGSISGTGLHPNGSTVTLTAKPYPGYIFINWTEDGTEVSTSASYSFTATATRNLVANFQGSPYAAWVATQFSPTELTNPSICGPLQTPEHDGICNLLKYAFAHDRKNPNRADLPQSVMENGVLSIIFTCNSTATDLDFTVEVSTDLQTWTSSEATFELIDSTAFAERYKVTPTTPNVRFIRLRVTQP